jgi:hypothetical protein
MLMIDQTTLTEGDFIWPFSTRRHANSLLRKYNLPSELLMKIGTKVRLEITYESFVPLSLSSFVFSAPWIVHGANVTIVVDGYFEYFVRSHQLLPSGSAVVTEHAYGNRRQVEFSCKGVMLPGSVMEVRWQRRTKPKLRKSKSG